MSNTYQIYLISDSTGETLDRIFLALKAFRAKNILSRVSPVESEIKYIWYVLLMNKLLINL